MSVFAIKWQEDILKDLLRDLQLCSENDKSIKLNSNQIDILLKYIEYLYKWVLDKDKEIERLNKTRETDIKCNKYLQKELAEAHSIIKEIREYCINRSQYFNEARTEQYTFSREEEYSIENILEILDKVNNNENNRFIK